MTQEGHTHEAPKLKSFKEEPVTFVETLAVKEGVVCDVYVFDSDKSKDLGIVTVSRGFKTPLQKILKGDKTLEGFVSGAGVLIVTTEEETKTYDFSNVSQTEVEVQVGNTMQWEANGSGNLVFYEICYPPYEDGRFENIPENK